MTELKNYMVEIHTELTWKRCTELTVCDVSGGVALIPANNSI